MLLSMKTEYQVLVPLTVTFVRLLETLTTLVVRNAMVLTLVTAFHSLVVMCTALTTVQMARSLQKLVVHYSHIIMNVLAPLEWFSKPHSMTWLTVGLIIVSL